VGRVGGGLLDREQHVGVVARQVALDVDREDAAGQPGREEVLEVLVVGQAVWWW